MLIPRPTYSEPEIELPDKPDSRWIRWYLDCPSWKCVKCGAVMFGRMEYCVYCKMVLHTHTPRTEDLPGTSKDHTSEG
jgi:hypothetical protein